MPVWMIAVRCAVFCGAERDALLGDGAATDHAKHAFARKRELHRTPEGLSCRGAEWRVIPESGFSTEAAADEGAITWTFSSSK